MKRRYDIRLKTPDTCTLRFSREALLYDISNYCFVEGDITQTESEHDKHQIMDVAEDGNVDRVTRVLDLAYSECVEMLYPYAKRAIDSDDISDELEEKEEYTIEMKMPPGFSMTTLDFLSTQIHEYMVARVVADWLSITKPTAAQNWMEKVVNAKAKIHGSLVNRMCGFRRKMSPF
jgi:hypothetical protein